MEGYAVGFSIGVAVVAVRSIFGSDKGAASVLSGGLFWITREWFQPQMRKIN